MTLVILLVLAVSLFALSYLTKRRYGVLGLGLAAGVVLADQLSTDVATILQMSDFPVDPLSYKTAAIIFLTLAPAVAMLFSGPKYDGKKAAIIGSVLFAVFGLILLLAPLSVSLPITDPAIRPVLMSLSSNSPGIIAIGIIAAVVDMMHSHGKKLAIKKGKH